MAKKAHHAEPSMVQIVLRNQIAGAEKPHNQKAVAAALAHKRLEPYSVVFMAKKRSSDRVKWMELPLSPGAVCGRAFRRRIAGTTPGDRRARRLEAKYEMSVLNPRNRLVNFRLSEVEFEKVKSACARNGARSISDFARTSVLHSLDESREPSGLYYPKMTSLDQKVADLEIRLEQILRLISATMPSVAAQAQSAGSPVAAGESKHN